MDISDIVKRHQLVAEEKARQDDVDLATKVQDERELRRLHALKLQVALQTIVAPVLSDGARQLNQNGYSSLVDKTMREDPVAGLKFVVVEVFMTTEGRNVFHHRSLGQYVIRYVGDVSKLVVNCTYSLNGQVITLEDGRNVPVDDLATPLIESQFRKFVDNAMRVDNGG